MPPISDIFATFILATSIAVALSVLIYYFVTGVVPMSSSRAEAAEVITLLKEAGVREQAVLYELGCGWGMLVSALARAFPEARIHGIEISPFPYWIARLRTRNMPNVRLQRGDFFVCDLRDADAVACYLMIKPMPKLAAFLDTMLKQGTPVVSLAFGFRDRQAAAVRKVSGLPGSAALYIWPALRRQSSTQR
jgi:trans-aconitate methyltransferase